MRQWLAHDLREVVGDLLLASDSRVAQLGVPRAVRALVSGLDDFSGNRAQAVWCLLMLELFLRAPARQDDYVRADVSSSYRASTSATSRLTS